MVKRKKPLHHHIDKSLRFRFWLFVLISVVMLCIIGYDTIIGTITPFYGVVGIVVGLLIGIASSRMFHFSWDHDVKKVIARLDWIGGVILAAYIIVAIFRTRLVGVFVHGPQVAPVGLAVITGTMIGRVLAMRHQIVRILREQAIL